MAEQLVRAMIRREGEYVVVYFGLDESTRYEAARIHHTVAELDPDLWVRFRRLMAEFLCCSLENAGVTPIGYYEQTRNTT